jgi:hypothetical protein
VWPSLAGDEREQSIARELEPKQLAGEHKGEIAVNPGLDLSCASAALATWRRRADRVRKALARRLGCSFLPEVATALFSCPEFGHE